jgi:glycerol-3-phosphate dehydrogenase
MKAPWTASGTLPGGDFPVNEFATQVGTLAKKYPFLELREARRLVRAYGTRAQHVMGNARAPEDLGRRFGPSLTEAEVRYLMDQEWATSAEDIVWRRSKLGLHMTTAEQSALEEFVASLLVHHQQPALASHV